MPRSVSINPHDIRDALDDYLNDRAESSPLTHEREVYSDDEDIFADDALPDDEIGNEPDYELIDAERGHPYPDDDDNF